MVFEIYHILFGAHVHISLYKKKMILYVQEDHVTPDFSFYQNLRLEICQSYEHLMLLKRNPGSIPSSQMVAQNSPEF